MRFIYLIMIGMVIFQGMLIVTGQFFPESVEQYGENAYYHDIVDLLNETLDDEGITMLYHDIQESTGYSIRYYGVEGYDVDIFNIFGFLADITRPPAKELGGLLADHVKYFRFKTQLKILKKAKEFHGLFGCKPQEVPLKFLSDLLDNCSWEEDEDMHGDLGLSSQMGRCRSRGLLPVNVDGKERP